MGNEARRAVVAALTRLAGSADYRDRADASRGLASFAEMPEAREPLLYLVLDVADTFVTRATAEALLRRQDGVPVVLTDGPFAETKDLIAGWMVIDVDSQERAIELAGELSAAPGAGGKPIHEWLEVRPFLGCRPTITE